MPSGRSSTVNSRSLPGSTGHSVTAAQNETSDSKSGSGTSMQTWSTMVGPDP